MRPLFIGPDGLRAGWRVSLYVLATLVVQTVIQIVIVKGFGYQPHPGFDATDFLLSDGVGALAALLVAMRFARVEGRGISDYGLPLRAAAIPQLLTGIGWGAAAVALTFALVAMVGGASVSGWALHGSALARSIVAWSATMLVLGLYEEYLFRGYVLVALARGVGFWPAAVVLSVGFGALHYYTKPMENVADALAVGLIGLFLCLTIRRTGTLWLAIGFHAAFDWTALILFAAPNTGNFGRPIPGHLLEVLWAGRDWLTGGPRGLEASVMIFPVMALCFAAFALRNRARPGAAGVATDPSPGGPPARW
jgi:CAAX protease family protein